MPWRAAVARVSQLLLPLAILVCMTPGPSPLSDPRCLNPLAAYGLPTQHRFGGRDYPAGPELKRETAARRLPRHDRRVKKEVIDQERDKDKSCFSSRNKHLNKRVEPAAHVVGRARGWPWTRQPTHAFYGNRAFQHLESGRCQIQYRNKIIYIYNEIIYIYIMRQNENIYLFEQINKGKP